MSRRIGHIDLPAGMVLQQAGSALGTGSAVRMSLAGRPLYFQAHAPQRLVLASEADSGWLSLGDCIALRQLCASEPVTELLWTDPLRSLAAQVAWDHDGGPALECSPLWPGCSWCTARLRLLILQEY